MPRDLTGNSKYRPPLCAVTKAMADAGVEQMSALVGLDLADGVTDQQLVAEIFSTMWKVYWMQVNALKDKNIKVPHSTLVLPPTGIVRQ